jgi:hypothetical protein
MRRRALKMNIKLRKWLLCFVLTGVPIWLLALVVQQKVHLHRTPIQEPSSPFLPDCDDAHIRDRILAALANAPERTGGRVTKMRGRAAVRPTTQSDLRECDAELFTDGGTLSATFTIRRDDKGIHVRVNPEGERR